MLSHLVRAQLAAELLAYAAIGAWLHRAHAVPPAAILGAALATALAARLAIVAFSVGLSWIVRSPRSPEQRIGLRGGAALVLGECRALLADNLWRLPFERWALRCDPQPARGGPVPVLMVHGYLSNRGLLAPLVRALDAAGATQVFTFNFSGLFGSIDALVEQLDLQVRRTLERTGHAQVVLVCHSMGGLVARAWLARHGARSAARVVSIASPHNGTALAALGWGENTRQMQRGSAFLRDLRSSEGERGPPCPYTSIYSVHDNLVAPQDTSRLAWAKNVALARWGHIEIVGADPVHLLVAEELRQAGALAPR